MNETSKYRVLNAFRHGAHWREPETELELLQCEATALINAGFIEPVTSKQTKVKANAAE